MPWTVYELCEYHIRSSAFQVESLPAPVRIDDPRTEPCWLWLMSFKSSYKRRILQNIAESCAAPACVSDDASEHVLSTRPCSDFMAVMTKVLPEPAAPSM